MERPEYFPGNKREELEWSEFKNLFKKQYLSERYYEINTKESCQLNLDEMSIEDLINKFLDLLWFMSYIKEEKLKVQRFLNCLSQSYKDRIEFDNPKTLDEVLRKARLCFEQYKQRNDLSKVWKGKEQENFNQRKKGFQPPPFRNMPSNLEGNSYNKNGQLP